MTWSFVLARRNFRAPRIKAATTLSRMKEEQPTIRIPLRITEYSNFYWKSTRGMRAQFS